MKRIIAILLAAVMIVPFAACAKKEDTKEEAQTTVATTEEAATETQDVATTQATNTTEEIREVSADVTRGIVRDNVYKNSFAGIEFKADKNWNFYTEEELAAELSVEAEAIADSNLAKTIAQQGSVYDMIASKIDSDNIMEATVTVSFIDGNSEDIRTMTAKDIALVVAEGSGADVEKSKGEEVVYGGNTYYQLASTTENSVNYISVCRIDDVIVMLIAAATPESDVDFSQMFK